MRFHPCRPYIHKWKNHFYEMKGDVGMSLHEKERNKKMPTPRHKVTHNPIPTSLFCFTCCLFVCYESFLFHEVTSLHPPSFHRNDFSTCSTHFSLGFAPRARRFMHAHAHADNAPLFTHVRVMHAYVMASFSVCP